MEGIEVERVSGWLEENTPTVEPPLRFELIAGGRSNLTYTVTDSAGRRLVLRRPPISHVLATAHDMGREHRIISALARSPVPVPRALGFCEDPEVNGAPFYVMELAEGHVLRSAEEAAAALDEASRRAAGENLLDALVALHELDPDEVGLGDLGKREDYLGRQLRRWYGQFQQSQQQEHDAGVHRPAEIVDEVHEMLLARKPEQQGAVIAHGDYRLDNCIFGPGGELVAVLDWELCTLGDPLADLGTLLIYWSDPGEARPGLRAASAVEGFPTRAELAARYGERSGRDTSMLAYYLAFGHWKLACIIEGVYVRYATGAMGDQPGVAEGMAGEVLRRGRLAREALASL